MIPFFLGVDNKPCIWPVPDDCTWTGERYKIRNSLDVFANDEFIQELEIFIKQLNDIYPVKAKISNAGADIKMLNCMDERIGNEGYLIDVSESGVTLQANTKAGIFYGCQTLLQLIINSPDPSIHGVKIIDKPLKPFRGVHVNLPGRENSHRFKRFVDFLAKYKFNKMVLEIESEACTASVGYPEKKEIQELIEYISSRHIEIIPKKSDVHEDFVSIGPETGSAGMGAAENKIYEILKVSCILWWGGYKTDRTAIGFIMPDYLERIAAQLYPMERDRMNRIKYPSSTRKGFKAIDIRAFYNSMLYRLSGRRKDNYDLMFLIEAKSLPNTVPFSIFQGVRNFGLDHSFILAGNGLNQAINGILINSHLSSLVFLHSYIINKCSLHQCSSYDMEENVVGYYEIFYKDGTKDKVKVEYGRTIFYYKADISANKGANDANPVYTGVTSYGIPYAIYSQEWINKKPDIDIEKIDIIPSENCEDGGIAVFGITAVK